MPERMPEAKAPAIQVALEMLNHHVPGFSHSEEFAKRLVEAIVDEVLSATTDKLLTLDDPDLITLRDKLLERAREKCTRAKEMADDALHLTTKCKLEGEQRGYYDAYCMADKIVRDTADRARAALMAGVAEYFDGVEA